MSDISSNFTDHEKEIENEVDDFEHVKNSSEEENDEQKMIVM